MQVRWCLFDVTEPLNSSTSWAAGDYQGVIVYYYISIHFWAPGHYNTFPAAHVELWKILPIRVLCMGFWGFLYQMNEEINLFISFIYIS